MFIGRPADFIMSENTDFQIVWAKCGSHFWPAEMMEFDKLPEEIQEDFPDDKKPLYVVKFFHKDGYEFLKDDKNLHPYNCKKKQDFIKKGIVKSRAVEKAGAYNSWFTKFSSRMLTGEKLTTIFYTTCR